MDLATTTPSAITTYLRDRGWIAGDTRVLALTEAGAGNMNIVRRVRLTTHGDEEATLILKQAPPFVARFPHLPAPPERAAVEAAFYRTVAGSAPVAALVPGLHGHDAGAQVLALEDLGNAEDYSRWYRDQPTRAEAKPVVDRLTKWLSQLHQLPVTASAFENRSMRNLNHAHIFDIPYRADSGVALTPALQGERERLAQSPAVRAALARLGAVYLAPATRGDQGSLLHGDFYPGSWLPRASGALGVLDVEFSFAGAPEFDLGVFIAHLEFCGLGALTDTVLSEYQHQRSCNTTLCLAFAGAELLRRLLGVAQLPLSAGEEQKLSWLEHGRRWLECYGSDLP